MITVKSARMEIVGSARTDFPDSDQSMIDRMSFCRVTFKYQVKKYESVGEGRIERGSATESAVIGLIIDS
jgi:hypothetical protein